MTKLNPLAILILLAHTPYLHDTNCMTYHIDHTPNPTHNRLDSMTPPLPYQPRQTPYKPSL